MDAVVKAARQCGISPKVLNSAIVGLLTAVLLKFGVSLDSVLEQFINVIAMIATAYLSPPGDVLVDVPDEDGNPALPARP